MAQFGSSGFCRSSHGHCQPKGGKIGDKCIGRLEWSFQGNRTIRCRTGRGGSNGRPHLEREVEIK